MEQGLPISIIILTFNEEMNLRACLDSARQFDDIHVLDSGSTDLTTTIARDFGARIYTNVFESFGQQRNWAIDNIPARHNWHFHLDADERLTPALISEMKEAIASDSCDGGYLVPSKLMFAGRWLRYAGQYPAYQLRLFHRHRLRFVNHGHGQREESTYPIGKLSEPYLHFAFSKGLDHWFGKHAAYARREAEQALGLKGGMDVSHGIDSVVSDDIVTRRRALKALSYRMPFRYALRLCYMLFWKRAIFDGAAGIAYSQMLATYESMISIHMRLLRSGLRPELPESCPK